MRRFFITAITILALIIPTAQVSGQSGDATWLESIDGLQTGIGRSWMAPISYATESTTTEFNELGTPGASTTTRTESTPIAEQDSSILMMSALIFEFDSPEQATEALEVMDAEQVNQLERDPRAPVMQDFRPDHLGDLAYGHEGVYATPDTGTELAVVYLMVQDDTYVYQVFSMSLPGDHVSIATGVAEAMIATEPGDDEPIYDMNGASTGGNWEKLNAITLEMPEGSTVNDLEVYPVDPDAVIGDSIVVPHIDLGNLANVPGITDSWHMTYQSHVMTELVGTPVISPDGVFSIELWVMEFSDPTSASAAVFAMSASLNEPLGITGSEGSSFGDSEGNFGITVVSTGFVRDRTLPNGDAATVVSVEGSTVYASRVYANGPAPTPLALKLVQYMIDNKPGPETEAVDDIAGTGGMWQKFPANGSDVVSGLESTVVRHESPSATPVPAATPS